MKKRLSTLLALALLFSSSAAGQGNNLAPGAPGRDAQWASAGKTAVGTSNTLESKVWFTLHGGVLTEVYYPTVDVACVQELQFAVVSGAGAARRVETESADATHRTEPIDRQALAFRQTNTAKNGAWTLTKTYVTDPERHTVLIEVEFRPRAGLNAALYVYLDPSLNNSGMHDVAWTEGGALLASDAGKTSALAASTGFEETTNGFLGSESDGLAELRRSGRLARTYPRALDGNVVQVGKIRLPAASGRGAAGAAHRFTLALGFGRESFDALQNARASLAKSFGSNRAEYVTGWHEYMKSLRRVSPQYQRQFDMAAMVLKAHEDKTYRGAMIASLSVPWGGGPNANEPNVGGYHLVWSRDLYHVATAFYLLGDKASADRALDYLFRVQQKPDGSFPQNSWLDGRPFWGSLQLDEVAYPLVLAYQFGRTDNETWGHVKRAADFLVKHGPYSPQERWEEESGYSPSTVAAEIAGLVCAAEVARRNNDEASASVYLAAADEWARNAERWLATTNGPHAGGNYYLRITENKNPNDGEPRELNNGAGTFDERQIVDAGFLELVRLGVRRADDPLVARSVAVVDQLIKVETPNGDCWYRYNHDGYGEMDDGRPWNFDGKYTGQGRLWVLLTAERGEYELARGERSKAVARLDAMMKFANEGLMLPEQIWDRAAPAPLGFRFGEGTGSATPLAWSMASFIRLVVSLEEGRNPMLPDIVAERYVKKEAPRNARINELGEHTEQSPPGTTVKPQVQLTPGSRAFVMYDGTTREVPVEKSGRLSYEIKVAEGEQPLILATVSPTGATSFQRTRMRGAAVDGKKK